MSNNVCETTLEVNIDGHKHGIDDPKPLGRQLLNTAGLRPVEEYVIFLLLQDGSMEEIGLDEPVDLRKPGIEKFLTFKTDRIFRFMLDGKSLQWGASLITGMALKKLAQVDPEKYGVWLEARGQGEDRPIANNETVDLSQEGLERFFTGVTKTTEG